MRFRTIIPLLVGGTVLAVVALLDQFAQARFHAAQQGLALRHVSAVRAALEGGLHARLHLTEGLVSHVSVRPDITQAEFRALAVGLTAGRTGIRSIQLARGTIVTHVYPEAGNEAARGLRLLEIPSQREAVIRALETRATVVAGPVDLVQGGTAIISRTPIYLTPEDGAPRSGPYWGLATILIDAPTLLREAGLEVPEAGGLRHALRGRDALGSAGEVFFGDPAVFGQEPVRMAVALSGGSWELGAVPVGGWKAAAPYSALWRWGGALLALLSGLLARQWLRYPDRLRAEVRRATAALEGARRNLEKKVQERTAELLSSNRALRVSEARLAEAQEIAGLGHWEWNVATGELYWSDEIYRIFGLEPQAFTATYDAFLATVHPDDRARVAEAVNAALEDQRPYALDHRIVRPDGSIRVVHEQGRVDFRADHRAVRMIGTVQDVSGRKEAERQLERLAYHDALTGLPNRVLMRDRLEHALVRAARQGRMVGVMFLDLDRFKNVNDSLGHEVGDRLLMEVARRLAEQVREGDTLARLGGDEFTLLLEDVDEPGQATRVAAKLLEVFARTFQVAGQELFVTASIGISLFPNDGSDAETLMKNADAAMYQAKELGRDGYQFFSDEMAFHARERVALEAKLRYAVERGELELRYQPVVAAGSGEIVALEALLRWNQPEHGLIEPGRLVPIAEDTGLIVPIGRWVLEQVCRDVRAWDRRGLPPVRVFANLSLRQFARGDLAEELRELLGRHEVDPERMGLEITETMLLKEDLRVNRVLHRLKELGVRVAVDDFGIGHSALVYLKRLAVDVLKIDRTFVRDVTTDPNDAAIIEAIVAMAHKLNLAVVAEGVETCAQRRAVQEFGCDLLQGHLFGCAVPADRVAELFAHGALEGACVGGDARGAG